MPFSVQVKETHWGAWSAAFFLLSLMLFIVQPSAETAQKPLRYFVPVGVLALGLSLIWFAHAFTGPADQKRPEQVKFSYFFVIASFAILVLPPLVANKMIGSEAMGIVSGCVEDTDFADVNCGPVQTDGAPTPIDGTRAKHNQWLVNIGGAMRPQADCPKDASDCTVGSRERRAYITGGLVVPLPLLVIALFGAAVSLSRRVPEIQKQSEPGYIGTTAQPALTATEAREYLTFQIMQFISAPLIAITAHQVIRPAGEAASVALAFMAGFGSETILLLIRGVAEGIKPKIAGSSMAERVGSVEGVISKDGTPVIAEVMVKGTQLKATSDDQGKFALKQVPAGIQILCILNDKTFESRDVTVIAGASTECNFDLATNRPQPSRTLLNDTSSGNSDAVIEAPVTVDIRLAIENQDLDPGTLRLFLDDIPTVIGDDGMVELSLPPGKSHRIRASAMQQGLEVRGERTTTVSLDDDGSSLSLKLK